jgi:hypothetical protein
MSSKERIFVYIIGFGIGLLLVSFIMSRRAAKEEQAVDPWVTHNQVAVEEGAEPLPTTLPDALQKGRILTFGYLPNATEPAERVWLLNFDESYPYVRIVEQVVDGSLQYMAADQILINLRPEIDVTEMQPMLDQLGLRVRMFNRKEHLLVVGVLSTQIDAVPATIAALQPWADRFVSAEPDFIRMQPKRPE